MKFAQLFADNLNVKLGGAHGGYICRSDGQLIRPLRNLHLTLST